MKKITKKQTKTKQRPPHKPLKQSFLLMYYKFSFSGQVHSVRQSL